MNKTEIINAIKEIYELEKRWAKLNESRENNTIPHYDMTLEELKDLKEEFEQELEEAEQKIDEAVEKVEEVAAANPEKVKFIYVTMDGDRSTTAYDDFITLDSDVLYTRTSWQHNGIIETYVDDWYVRIDSSEDETWTLRLRVSKPYDF